jgi:murein DD-endopeptidase MepM/ murein hydrolase activator NlpD
MFFSIMRRFLPALACLLALSARAQRIEIGWPTPNPAYFEGKPITDFIQPTGSGESESGLFGCRRSGGAQFHEGLDLKPLKRDRHGEPTDPVFAAMKGVVRYVGRIPGNSNYGRYIVLEHPDMEPAVYTLYAHLADIAPGLSTGDTVAGGQTIGAMGRSSSTQAIPRERAHLHFEMGVLLTRDFDSWFDWKKFGSHNQQGIYNGMNLLGFDPLDFFNEFRARRVDTIRDYFAHMQTAVRLRVATRRIPDYMSRYPSLLTKPLPADGLIGGWEVHVNEMGLPFSLTPLSPMEAMGLAPDEVRVLEADETLMKHHRCKSLVFSRHGNWALGRDLKEVLQLVFGLR